MLKPDKEKYNRKQREGRFVKKDVLITDNSKSINKTYTLGDKTIKVSKQKHEPTPRNLESGIERKYKSVNVSTGSDEDDSWKFVKAKIKREEFSGKKTKSSYNNPIEAKKGKHTYVVKNPLKGKTITKSFYSPKDEMVSRVTKEKPLSGGKIVTTRDYDKKGKPKSEVSVSRAPSGGKDITTRILSKKGKVKSETTVHKPNLRQKISSAINKPKASEFTFGKNDEELKKGGIVMKGNQFRRQLVTNNLRSSKKYK